MARIEVFTGPESGYFATSALVLGESAAILVDTQLTRSAGRELAEWTVAKTPRLDAVIVTDPHADRYFGTEEVLRLFPDTPVYATPEVVRQIVATGLGEVARWQATLGADVTSTPVVPGPLRMHRFPLGGGVELTVVPLGRDGTAARSIVHVPALGTVVAGVLADDGTHVWTGDTTPEQRADWRADLELVRAFGAERVIAGHRVPNPVDEGSRVLDFTSEYLRVFDAALARHGEDVAGVVAEVNARYGGLTLPGVLSAGAEANAARDAGAGTGTDGG